MNEFIGNMGDQSIQRFVCFTSEWFDLLVGKCQMVNEIIGLGQ